MQRLIYLLVISFLFLSFMIDGKHDANKSSFQIVLQPVFNNKELQLNTQAYLNPHGDTLYIDEFKFYISNLKLKSSANKNYLEKDSYHLVDAEDSTTEIIELKNIAEGSYNELHFFIGVDSAANVSGALSGDLDPIKGMYWAWNTGYINAKLIGHSNVCKTLHQAFEFHIGGYLSPYKTMREVVLQISTIQIKAGTNSVLKLNVDVAKWFTQLDLRKTNNVVIPCKEAVLMADRYKNMFSVVN